MGKENIYLDARFRDYFKVMFGHVRPVFSNLSPLKDLAWEITEFDAYG